VPEIVVDEDEDVVKVDGVRAHSRRSDGMREIYVTRDVVVKLTEGSQNRREAEALRDPRVRLAARRAHVVLPRLLAVGPRYRWIAVERLPLRRPRLSFSRRDALYERVERVMDAAGRCDHSSDFWNWAMVGDRPAVYDLGM